MAIPTPEPGLVISYSYLWHHQHETGSTEGRKNRPALVVLVTKDRNSASLVTVLPITHAPQADPRATIPVPARVKQHLGLDDLASWIVVSEGNEFVWPGYDLRKIPNTDRYDYGFLPPRLFDEVTRALMAWHQLARRQVVNRD